MMQVRQTRGKLCEVMYVDPLTDDDLASFTLEVRRLVTGAAAPLVFVCDWRRVGFFSKTMADTIVWIMRRDNPRIAFNAILVDPANVRFRRQVEDILTQAQNPHRKCFVSDSALITVIEGMLNGEERIRVLELIRDNEPGSMRSVPPRSGPPKSVR